jgi:hypothetical protein
MVEAQHGETNDAALARAILDPVANAAIVTKVMTDVSGGDLDIGALTKELLQHSAAATRGDLTRHESMLAAQAHTLDQIFSKLAYRAAFSFESRLDSAERYMRLALKAQSQCRATIETLAAIKNPPMVIAKQANVTSGPQQINNNFASSTPVGGRAGNFESMPNELLEQTNGERLDAGTAGKAIGSDSHLATVGAIHRPTD